MSDFSDRNSTLFSATVINYAGAKDLDISKILIIDKFEVWIEIYTSVVFWNSTSLSIKIVLKIV